MKKSVLTPASSKKRPINAFRAPLRKKKSGSKTSPSLKVTVFWGDILYGTALCHENEAVTVGTEKDSTFHIDLGEASLHETLEIVKVFPDHSAELRFNESLGGHVRLDGKLFSLGTARQHLHAEADKHGIYRIRFGKADKADIVVGHVSFYFDWVDQWETLPRGINSEERRRWWKMALPLILLPFLLSVLVFYIPQPEVEKPPERLVTLLPRQAPAKAALGARQTEDGGAAKGDPGKVDSKPVEKVSAAAQLRRANIGSMLSGLTSVGSNAPTNQAVKDAHTDLNQQGTGGLSTTGLKTGAGGKTVGLGRTVGQGQGGFEGTGRLGLSGDAAVEGGTGYGKPDTIVRGGLSSDVIESVIRKRQHRIRLCYERQLNFNPKLTGKIGLHFVIGKNGGVMKANVTEDTMKNETVKQCVLEEVKTWIFPAPEGGTLVDVDYPFVFESSSNRSN